MKSHKSLMKASLVVDFSRILAMWILPWKASVLCEAIANFSSREPRNDAKSNTYHKFQWGRYEGRGSRQSSVEAKQCCSMSLTMKGPLVLIWGKSEVSMANAMLIKGERNQGCSELIQEQISQCR